MFGRKLAETNYSAIEFILTRMEFKNVLLAPIKFVPTCKLSKVSINLLPKQLQRGLEYTLYCALIKI